MKPDAELCRRYGTKVAESPLLEAAAAMLGTGGILAEQHHVRREQEREAMAELAARRAETERMLPTRRGLRMPGGLVPQDVTDYAGAGSLRDMDPSLLGSAIGFEKGGAKTAAPSVEGVGKLVGGLAMRNAGIGAEALGQGVQAVGQGLQHGFGATGRLVRAAGPTLMEGIKSPGLAPRLGKAVGNAGRLLDDGGTHLAIGGTSKAIQAVQAMKAPAPSPSLFAGKPLLSLGTKAKLLGTAGALGAGYAGMKTLGAVKDYMEIPAGAHHQRYLRSDVNEYGY